MHHHYYRNYFRDMNLLVQRWLYQERTVSKMVSELAHLQKSIFKFRLDLKCPLFLVSDRLQKSIRLQKLIFLETHKYKWAKQMPLQTHSSYLSKSFLQYCMSLLPTYVISIFLDYTLQRRCSQSMHTYPYKRTYVNSTPTSIFEDWNDKFSR